MALCSGNGNILVVDDDLLIHRLLQAILSPEGYHLAEALSCAQAQIIMESRQPDLILLDYEMPGKDGIKFLTELRQEEKFQFLPVVMITASSVAELKLSAIREGVTDFVRKPFDAEELKARVKSLLKLKFLTDELENAGCVINSLADVIDARDHYTCGHSRRVAEYSVILAEQIGLGRADVETLSKGAFFHDIGKIGVRDNVLLKDGRLTPEEREQIKIHSTLGYELLKGMKTLKETLPLVRHHHERLDGSGYPDGLSGSEISTNVRIASIADVYDALATDRPYRKALSLEESFKIMKEECDKGWWDRELVGEFESAMIKRRDQAKDLE